jgi:fibronectin-binding autotransporter adhesin
VCSFPSEVLAETYLVASETELRDAITAANADGDASATIVLTGSFAVSAPNLPSPTKPMTIDTQGFTLAGAATNGAISFTDTGGNTVTISGTLAGAGGSGAAGGGIGLWARSSLVASSVVNEALITGGAGGAGGGAGGTGTRILSTTFVNEGTVRGGEGGGGGNGGAGLQLSRNSTATNNGLIEGGTGAAGGAGTATGGAGVEFSVPIGASTLINNGVIRGGSGGASGLFASGVIVRSTGNSIVNTGTIEGGLGGAGIAATNGTLNLDIVNSGTIRAGDGQTDAINRLAAATTGTLTLELQAGSVIEGNVVAGATPTADILRLGGTGSGTFDVSEIGAAAQYQNFDVFQKTGAGTWALTGTGTATTDWDIQAGTLQLGDGGTSGSIVGNVVNNGVFAFNRSDDFVYGGVISGSGSVGQIGSGTTTLTGTNTYEGGTFISAGTLSIDRDANLGAASGALVLANGALSTRADMTSSRTIGLTGFGAFLVDPATTLTLDGVISGTGSLAKGSVGTLVLSGTNTYEGGTSISGGTLQVSSDVNLGDAAGGLTFDGGTLNTTASLISGRNVGLLGTGRLLTDDAGTTFTLGGVISGGGTLYKERARAPWSWPATVTTTPAGRSSATACCR